MRKPPVGAPIDEFCREQICEWTFRVVDYFRIDREVVSMSLNYLDRFLCLTKEGCDRPLFKLAATTTLYMAVKVFYPNKLGELGILSDLSRGEFTMRDVADLESHMLNLLQWNLHPPTSAAFAQILLDYLNVKLPEVDDLYANTAFFSELAVCDYFFVGYPPSTVALACILNALEGMMGAQSADLVILEQVRPLQIPTVHLDAIRSQLWDLYERSEECALHAKNDNMVPHNNAPAPTVATFHSTNKMDTTATHSSSPVSVATATRLKTDCTTSSGRELLTSHGSW